MRLHATAPICLKYVTGVELWEAFVALQQANHGQLILEELLVCETLDHGLCLLVGDLVDFVDVGLRALRRNLRPPKVLLVIARFHYPILFTT